MVYDRTYEYLNERLQPRVSSEGISLIDRAYELASEAHAGQIRDEGTSYIVHPVRVAISLVDELNIHSPELISSALLHDVIEDSDTTREDIEALFGSRIARIVWLLTKLQEVTLPDYLAAIEAEPATGAPIVKLCDRLDNLRFLAQSPKLEKKIRYIRTTEIFYLPMAERTDRYLYDQINLALDSIKSHVAALV